MKTKKVEKVLRLACLLHSFSTFYKLGSFSTVEKKVANGWTDINEYRLLIEGD
jgi:hypothetical protein